MRVIKENPRAEKPEDNSTTFEPEHQPEQEVTCTGCLSEIAFRPNDPEVTTTNELEYLFDCPVCGISLEVSKHTGIVRQRS